MKKKIIIWGTKEKAIRLCHFLDMNVVQILAFTDNECTKKYIFRKGIRVLPLYEALEEEYDYIVIASAAWTEITIQLQMKGIDDRKIIQAYNSNCMLPNTLYFFGEIDKHREKVEIFTNLDMMILGEF